jgi:glycosyltransferase involved in cell wall biosynthesis
VYWLQDIFSVAVSKLVTKQLGFPGKAVGWYYQFLDRRQFRGSDAIVAITDDFVPLARAWAGSDTKVSVIENWAPIDEIRVGEKDNDWSRLNGLNKGFTFLYTGTLGRKHNPDLLLQLAEEFGSSDPVAMVVVAQGVSVQQLHDAKVERHIDSLTLLPLQPAEHYHDVLSTADVLVAMIEADAGTFAVPSKVSSYLCAGRPILLAAPKGNLAAQIVERANAGIVVEPADEAGFIRAARRLREDSRLREQLGANGRAYAERTFNIQSITDKFERVLIGGASGQAA